MHQNRSRLVGSHSRTAVQKRLLRAASGEMVESLESRLLMASIVVNSTADNVNDDNIAGTTTTLREAINYANEQGGAQTITLDPVVFASPQIIDLGKHGLLDVANANITIVSSAGLLITSEVNSTIFAVAAGSSLNLTGVSLSASDTSTGSITKKLPGGWNRITNVPQNPNPIDPPTINSQGSVTLSDCTFTSSDVSVGAAAIYSGGTLSASDCTFTGNTGAEEVEIAGIATLANCTFSGSTDSAATVLVDPAGALTLNNTIVDGNVLENNGSIGGTNNLITGAITGTGSGFLGNAVSGALLIDPLSDNGGAAPTMALLPGSAGIGAGSVSAASGQSTDERGQPRLYDGTVDVGAFQTQGFTITSTGGGNQSATVGQEFATPLSVTVASPIGDPVTGGVITFSGPASGASIATVTGTADVNGNVSETVAANAAAGTYNVTASAGGPSAPANFSLTNTSLSFGSTAANGPNTLRAAILAADELGGNQTIIVNFSGPEEIDLGSFVPLPVRGEGPPSVNITIDASNGLLITGAQNTTIFNVAASCSLNLTGLTLSSSDDQKGSHSPPGGWNRVTNVPTLPGTGLGDPPAIDSLGALTLSDCTFTGDTVTTGAAAIYSGGTLCASNCTFSGNSGDDDVEIAGTATMANCTFSGSTDNLETILVDRNAVLTLNNTIVDGNNLANSGSIGGTNNLITGSVLGAGSGFLGNAVSGTLLIDPLADNGGVAPTMALLPGSAGIAAGNVSAASGQSTDERGEPRVYDGTVDVGAFQTQGFTVAITGGNNQSTTPGSPFTTALSVNVSSPIGDPVAGGVITFSAPASGASVTFSDNPVTLDGNGDASTTVTANSTGGSFGVSASAGGVTSPANFLLTNTRPTAGIQLGNLTPVYNGSAQAPTVSTTPAGLSYTIAYTQGGVTVTSPTAAGTYNFTVTITDATYQGMAAGNLTIGRASTMTTVADTGGTYSGSPFGASGGVSGVGLVGVSPTSFSYAGTGSTVYATSSTAPTNAGTYTVTATYIGDANHNGSSSAALPFTIYKATTTTNASDGGGTFTGSMFPATGSVSGVGLVGVTPTSFSFAGTGSTVYPASATAPTNAGTYTVTASYIGDANHAGSASAAIPFTILQAPVMVTASDAGGTFSGAAFPATGTASGAGGLSTTPTSFSYAGTGTTVYPASATAPTNAGTYTFTATYNGDANHSRNSSAAVPFTIAQATATITVTDAGGVYTGSPYAATSTVTGVNGANLGTPNFTYYLASDTSFKNPSTIAPTAAGSYLVIAVYPGSTNYIAVGTNKYFSITQAPVSVTVSDAGGTYNGLPFAATGTVTGAGSLSATPTFTYVGTGSTVYAASSTAPTNAGTYTVTAKYAGDTNHLAGSSSALAFTIAQATTVLTPVAATVAYGGSTNLSTTLKTSGGAALAGLTVTFTLNGKTIGTGVTNASGVATLAASLAGIAPGVYTSGIAVSFAGNSNAKSASATASLTVQDAPIIASVKASALLNLGSVSGSFTQARTGAAAGDFVATVNWGDGSATQQLTLVADLLHSGQFDLVGANHVYSSTSKVYTVTVTMSTVGKFGTVAGATTTYTTTITA